MSTNASIVTDDDLLARYPGHNIDHDNKAVYRGWLDRRLLVHRCRDCGLWSEPPFSICPSCWSTNLMPTEVSGDGAIFMYVLLYQGPPATGVDYSTPYPVVTVELDEQPGLRITSTVVGASNDDIAIGRRVRLDWVERDGAPMPVFRLRAEDEASA